MEILAVAFIITNALWAGLYFYLMKLHNNEKKELRDRFMARDFGEYKYYSEELPQIQQERRDEIKEKKKEEKKQKPLTNGQRKIQTIAEKF